MFLCSPKLIGGEGMVGAKLTCSNEAKLETKLTCSNETNIEEFVGLKVVNG